MLQSGGLPATYPGYLRDAVTMTSAEQGAYVREGLQRAGQPRGFVEDGGPRLLLIGDSHSQDFYNMIRETGAFPGYQIVVRYVQARCQIYLGPEDITPVSSSPRDRRMCAKEPPRRGSRDLAGQADVVVFAAKLA